MPLQIKVRAVTFGYQPDKPVFSNFSVNLPRPKCVVLSGDNGVGKTTFLHLISGILQPQSGKILFDEISYPKWDKADLYHKISILRQRTEQNILGVTPLEDLKLWLKSDERIVSEYDVRLNNTLAEWDLAAKKDTPVWELSAGELKRTALAGFCLNKERYWLLDEPMMSLDEKFANMLLRALYIKKQIKSGMLIVTHNPALFSGIADEYWVLSAQGKIEVTDHYPGEQA